MQGRRLILSIVALCTFMCAPRAARGLEPNFVFDDVFDTSHDIEEPYLGALGGAAIDPLVDTVPSKLAWLSVRALARDERDGTREIGGLLMMGFATDRLLHSRESPRGLSRIASSDDASGPDSSRILPSTRLTPSSPPALVVSPRMARQCVRVALKVNGLADDIRLDAMRDRARLAGAFPEVRLRASRAVDDTLRLAPTESDPRRVQQASGTTQWLEARLTWRLDRLVFADEEPSLERIRADRHEARAKLASMVLKNLFHWQRAKLAEQDTSLSTEEHLAAVVERAEAEASLDVATGGWFHRWVGADDGAAPATTSASASAD